MTGIYPAVMTGYDVHGDVSIPRTLDLVDRLLESGVHGLFIGGTAGEGPLQSVDERKELATAIMRHVDGAVPVISHVGALPFRDTLELARHARANGVGRVAAIPPLYYAMSVPEIAAYFRALAAALGEPVMAYHVPHLTHRAAPAAWLAGLAHEGVIDGVKFSADDLAEIQAVIEQSRGTRFTLLSGSDPLCMASALVGSAGAVGVSINAMPGIFVRLWDAVAAGDLTTAAELQRTISRFVTHMFGYNFIAYLRHVLARQGVDIGPNRIPLPNLTPEDRRDIDGVLDADPDLRAALGLA
jgi:dihydrodipicolinate synthase/N-acetylneuraminate lyase